MLERHSVDISSWEEIQDIYEKELWQSRIVLTREVINQKYHLKILFIEDENKFKIKTSVIEDEITF